MTDDASAERRPDDPSGIGELEARLEAERPVPSPTLRRRVRGRIQAALRHRVLRRRAVGLWTAGAALLVLSVALALSGAPK
ncbi:hypothetical protein [Patulibacter sp. SYSU D01012]|uniref:hypothetical protein n=1 Tax=Patulibacter sp. SYSU D01012 TaxID=2817381 RepID=UPI001B30DA4D|nr:hypothetical protein [Patulibacter sp. SYSU D01012]